MMLSREPIDRPQSAQEVIEALALPPLEPTVRSREPVPPPPIPVTTDLQEQQASPVRRWSRARYAFLAVLAMVFAVAIHYFFFRPCLKYSCNVHDSFSWGEEVLINNSSDEKRTGTEAFKRGDYKDAISNFIESLNKNPNDPEALIYLNNAIAALTDNPKKIATSVPIQYSNTPDLSKETLRGVAQALSEYNCDSIDNFKEIMNAIKGNKNAIDEQIKTCTGQDNKLLQVEIADESKKYTGHDNTKNAHDVAEKLKDDNAILAVIGHSGSSTTEAAAEVYNTKLVLISPDSTVVRKNKDNKDNENENKDRLPYKLFQYKYLFRTSPPDAIAANNLVDYIANNINDFIEKENQTYFLKVGIVIKSKEEYSYSDSFQNEFQSKLKLKLQEYQNKGKIPKNINLILPKSPKELCNLSSTPSTPKCDIKKYDQETKPNVLLLSFDLDEANQFNYSIFNESRAKVILCSDGVYLPSKVNKSVKDGTIKHRWVFAVPWHRSNKDKPESGFEKNFNKLWGNDEVDLDWRTAMAYDATKVITEGIKKLVQMNTKEDLDRQGLYTILDKNFKVDIGAAGKPIKFDDQHDRDRTFYKGVLVGVPSKSNELFILENGTENQS